MINSIFAKIECNAIFFNNLSCIYLLNLKKKRKYLEFVNLEKWKKEFKQNKNIEIYSFV